MSTSTTVCSSKHRKLKGSREGAEATPSPRTDCSTPVPEQPGWLGCCHAPALQTESKTSSSLQCHQHIPEQNSFSEMSKSQACDLVLTLLMNLSFRQLVGNFRLNCEKIKLPRYLKEQIVRYGQTAMHCTET